MYNCVRKLQKNKIKWAQGLLDDKYGDLYICINPNNNRLHFGKDNYDIKKLKRLKRAIDDIVKMVYR